jgi:hypothetical protein
MTIERRPDTPRFVYSPTLDGNCPNVPKVLRVEHLARHIASAHARNCHERSDTATATDKNCVDSSGRRMRANLFQCKMLRRM